MDMSQGENGNSILPNNRQQLRFRLEILLAETKIVLQKYLLESQYIEPFRNHLCSIDTLLQLLTECQSVENTKGIIKFSRTEDIDSFQIKYDWQSDKYVSDAAKCEEKDETRVCLVDLLLAGSKPTVQHEGSHPLSIILPPRFHAPYFTVLNIAHLHQLQKQSTLAIRCTFTRNIPQQDIELQLKRDREIINIDVNYLDKDLSVLGVLYVASILEKSTIVLSSNDWRVSSLLLAVSVCLRPLRSVWPTVFCSMAQQHEEFVQIPCCKMLFYFGNALERKALKGLIKSQTEIPWVIDLQARSILLDDDLIVRQLQKYLIDNSKKTTMQLLRQLTLSLLGNTLRLGWKRQMQKQLRLTQMYAVYTQSHLQN